MRLTKPVAGLLLSASLLGTAQAQGVQTGALPAEFPPATYEGTQYVDSTGCVFIRAGIDGAVTWVPRVTRDRKQVCGYKPTAIRSTAQTSPTAPKQQVEQITLTPPPAAPVPVPKTGPNTTTAATAPATTAPTTAAPKPARDPFTTLFGTGAQREPSPAPPPTVFQTTKSAPPPAAAPQPKVTYAPVPPKQTTAAPVYRAPAPVPVAPAPRTVTTAPVAAPVTTAPASGGPCVGASALSQQYINTGPGVRCGPQAESPVSRVGDQSSALVPLDPDTRVIPLHVYRQRVNSTNMPVPDGYRRVWDDDRLNPERAIRTLAPPTPRPAVVPKGYRQVWDDGRLNPNRGPRTAQGTAQMGTIWQDDVPLQHTDPNVQAVRLPAGQQVQAADTLVTKPRRTAPSTQTSMQTSMQTGQTATRTVAKTPSPQPQATKPHYVRVAAYASEADARSAAKQIARQSGLSMKLGTLKRGNQTYKLVLAGPYSTAGDAQSALGKVQGAGYTDAQLLR